jgi:hypothetical protein
MYVKRNTEARSRITRWFKYDRDDLCVNKSQFVLVIFEPPCIFAVKKSNKYCIFVCAYVRLRKRSCVCSGGWACACACVHVALLILHAKRMRHIKASFVASLAPSYFSTLFHKMHDFRKKKLLNIKCVFWFSLQSVFKITLILRRIQLGIVINVKSLHVKCLLFLSDFNETWIFSTVFF